MNVIRVRASYAPTAKFTTWLYTLAHHRLVDHWRANGQVGFVSIDDEDDDAMSRVESIAGLARRRAGNARRQQRDRPPARAGACRAAGRAARSVPAAAGGRIVARGDRRAHRRGRGDGQEPVALCDGEASHRTGAREMSDWKRPGPPDRDPALDAAWKRALDRAAAAARRCGDPRCRSSGSPHPTAGSRR